MNGGLPSLRSRLPAIPALTTAIDAEEGFACRRVASASGHRASRSGVEPTPSVIESPSTTTVPASGPASTSTPVRK